MTRIIEFEGVVKGMEEKYGMVFKQFEDRDMLNKLGHSWDVEQDYYDWDRAATELKKFKDILKSLEESTQDFQREVFEAVRKRDCVEPWSL